MEQPFAGGLVTVLITDVEASTALRTKRGDEEAHRQLRDLQGAIDEEVARHGGRVVKTLGDGTLAAFESPRQAVSCAIAIQGAMEGLNRAHPEDPLLVRIGLNTGEVVLEGGDIFGETVNAASRISSLAEGGHILVSSVVKELAGTVLDTKFVDRGLHQLKGFPEEWKLYEVVRDKPAPVILDRTPFVGREEELTELRTRIGRAHRGHGSVVMISGEPGVGKTRLATEAAEEARRRGFIAFSGHCYEVEGALPYIPFVEILERTAEIISRQDFREILGDSAAELARLFPELRQMYPDIPPPVEVPAEQRRRFTFNSIIRYVSRAAATSPLLLVLDDLHWADESTLLLLEQLALNVADVPVLIVGTYRDVDLAVGRPLARTLEQLLRQRLMARFDLKRLSEKEVRAMLYRLTGAEPPSNVVSVIYAETEGNPFFVEEVFRHLTEEGKLLDPSGLWRTDLALTEVDVPESVRLVIGRRLERLGEDTRRALVTAAVLGRVFDFELLSAAGEVQGDALLNAVDQAERARLVSSVPHERGVRYQFVHELVRQTLLAELSLPRRQLLHLELAEAMEGVYVADLDRHIADLAHHLYQAGAAADADKTVRYLLEAGNSARSAAAYEEALRSYERALSLVDDENVQRGAILYGIGRAKQGLGRWREALSAWHEALPIFETSGDVERTARMCLVIADQYTWRAEWANAIDVLQRGLEASGAQASTQKGSLLALQALCYSWFGDFDSGRRCLDAGAQVAAQLEDPRLVATLQSAEAIHLWCFGHITEAIEKGLSAVEALRRADAPWALATALGYLEYSLGTSGRWREHDEVYEEVWPLANRLNQPTTILFAARWNERIRYLRTADLESYADSLLRDLEFNREHELPWIAETHSLLGAVELRRGNWDAALDHCIEGDRLSNEGALKGMNWGALLLTRAFRGERSECTRMLSEPPVSWPRPGQPSAQGAWLALLAAVQAWAVLGEWDEIARHYDALREAMRLGWVWGWFALGVPVDVLCAIAAAASGRHEDAERHYETALERGRAEKAPVAEADGKWLYSLALAAVGRPQGRERAAALLADATEAWRGWGLDVWTERAQELLAGQAGSAAPPYSTIEESPLVNFKKEGDFWTLGTPESPVRLKDSVGLHHLQQLLKNPGVEIQCLELVRLAEGVDRSVGPSMGSDGGELLDDQAKDAYRKRVRALEEELEEAEEWSDNERATRLRLEMQAITDELTRAVGLGGRDRKAVSNAERARVNVTKAVRSAVKRIRGADSELGRHLEESVRTGTVCSYSPAPNDQISWKF